MAQDDSFQLSDAEIPDFKSLKDSFKMLHKSMAEDLKAVCKGMDELHSITDNLRSSKCLDDIFTTEHFEELRRVISSCEVPIQKFNDLLSTLREGKRELSELNLTPFMRGTGEEPFACIFAICTQETPLKVFQSPGSLLWHLYHSHGLNIEPVGKPKHPGFWETILLERDDWETNWKQGWDEKKRLVDETLTNSIDWERINSPERTGDTSIAKSVGRKLPLDNLRCSLLLSIRGNEFGLTLRLKALILKMYLDISLEIIEEINEIEPSSEILKDIRRLLLQINDRSDYILATLHKTRTEIARKGIDWPAQISIVRTIDSANSSNAKALQILRSFFEDLVLKGNDQPWKLLEDLTEISASLGKCAREQAWTVPEPSRSTKGLFDEPGSSLDYERSVVLNRWENFRRHDYQNLNTSVNVFDLCASGPAPYSAEVSRRLPKPTGTNVATLDTWLLDVASLNRDAQYRYSPLNYANDEIRLLRLLPGQTLAGRLMTVSLAELPAFVALSYSWGDKNKTEKIYLDEGSLEVTTNLSAALRSRLVVNEIEQTDLKAIWADAICINQEDDNEKSQQVMRMRQIFMQARTIAWLGEEADNSQDAVELIRELSSSSDSPADISQAPNFSHRLLALKHLFERPWWNRVWIIQEYVVGRASTLICGTESLCSGNLHNAVRELGDVMVDGRLRPVLDSIRDSKAFKRIESFEILGTWWSNAVGGGIPLDLLTVLLTSRSSLASDLRDKVYGILGLAFDASHIIPIPDYTASTEQVYRRLVPSCVAEYNNLEVMCFAENLKPRNLKETKDLPSWAPDWSDDANLSSFSAALRLVHGQNFNAGRWLDIGPTFSGDLSTVIVTGFHVDDITFVSEGNQSAQKHGILESDLLSHHAPYGDGVDIAIVRTLSALHHTLGFPPEDQQLVQLFLQLCNFSGHSKGADDQISLWYQAHKDLQIGGKSLHECFTLREGSSGEGQDDRESGKPYLDYIRSFRQAFTQTTTGRTLFCTRRGYVGLGRESISESDLICILPGCSVPMILRRENWYYRLVGDSYVHGMMFGEVLDNMTDEERLVKLESFLLK